MAGKTVRAIASAVLAVTLIGCTSGNRSESTAVRSDASQKRSSRFETTIEPLALHAAMPSAQPQLTSSPTGVIVSWLEQKGATSILRFSERKNASAWSTPQTIASGDDWFVSWADVPSVMRLSDGTLVAQWLKAVDVAIEAYDLRISYSRDNGRSWARPFAPHHDGTKTQHGFASLFEWPESSGSGNTLGLVWLDGRDTELNTTDREGGAMGLHFASFDSAWKQTAEAQVDSRVCECCPTSVAVTSEGVIAAFRDRSPREIRDIHVSRFEKGAWTYPTPVHVDNWEIPSCPVNGPAISARGRQVAVAWFTVKDDQGHAYAAFSNDAGRTWGEPIRLDDETAIGHVDIELLSDSAAVATWVEYSGQRSHFRARRVEMSGARSQAVEVAGSGSGRVSGYPRAALLGDELVFAWAESSGEEETNLQVRSATARIP